MHAMNFQPAVKVRTTVWYKKGKEDDGRGQSEDKILQACIKNPARGLGTIAASGTVRDTALSASPIRP
jgi:hypothetical protein